MAKTLNIKLRIWRQDGPEATGRFVDYAADGISEDASFLEMLDIVNERLIDEGRAHPLRPRLPRGHLRHVRRDHQRHGPRPREGAPPPASSTCASSTTATRS